MSESSAMNSIKADQKDVHLIESESIKAEVQVTVKAEPLECLMCAARTDDSLDIYHTSTASGTSLHHFLSTRTQVDISPALACPKCVCKSCFELMNVLEQAEVEYIKLKEAFETIISKNPIFELAVFPKPIQITPVKLEAKNQVEQDSEDEPLAQTKKRNNLKSVKKKKKGGVKDKIKNTIDNSWECEDCGMRGDSGGAIGLASHKLIIHAFPDSATIKTEDGSQSPYLNGMDNELDISYTPYDDDDDDDDDSTFNPTDLKVTDKKKQKVSRKRTTMKRKTKATKVMHPCDQCGARYTSIVRLERHRAKHDGSKPPYICEVCGAHYKHKRACDIHIALHNGISDWKCEECNKLFPSKNALQRHNNIHTGKLNYQCDLCGKSFIHTSSFKMHKLTHSGLKPHACDVCGLALMTRSHLQRHKRVHSGEKRHECAVCGKRFSERYNLAAHARSHADPAAAPGAPGVPGPGAPAEPRRRFFRCHFCAERFERRYMLERHCSAAHGRALERPPPTPRNTMSKLLKQRAGHASHATLAASTDTKKERSPERPPASKLLAQLTSSSSVITQSSWSGAYVAEFGLRSDFPH